MPSLIQIARSRLAQGTFAGFYGLFVQTFVQLISVPILSHGWGLAGYGVWVMLFSIPSLLAMADLGLTAAGANEMTMATAQGDRPRAARIHMGLRIITMATGLVLLAIAALFILVINPDALDFGQAMARSEAEPAALFLCLYGFLALINGVTLAGYRAADAFAAGGLLYQTVILLEAMAAMATVIAGGTPSQVAGAYFLARLAGTVVMTLALRRKAPWLSRVSWKIDRHELAALVRPALAALVIPGAYAVVVQGSILAIGAIGGPHAIPAFSVVRTLSRTALQFAFRFNIASMPRFTVHWAQDNRDRASELVVLNLFIAFALVIPAALVLLVLGLPIVRLWTANMVHPSFLLLAILVAVMVANAAWIPISNLILSINHHAAYAYHFLVLSLVAVALGAALVPLMGPEGMAWALLGLELVMAGHTWRIAQRLGMLDRPRLKKAARSLIGQLRPLASSAKNPEP